MPNRKRPSNKTHEKKQKDRKTRIEGEEALELPIHQVLPYLIGAFSVFLLFCLISADLTGFVGVGFQWLFNGCFGVASITVPILMFILALFWRKQLKKSYKALFQFILFQILFFIFLSALLHMWLSGSMNKNFGKLIPELWNGGQNMKGSGLIGGLLGVLLYRLTGSIGTNIIGISALLIFGLFMFGLTPYSIYIFIRYKLQTRSENKAKEREAENSVPTFKTKNKPVPSYEEDEAHDRVRRDPNDRHRFEPDEDENEDGNTSVLIREKRKNKPADETPPFDLEDDELEDEEETENEPNQKITKKKNPEFSSKRASLKEIFTPDDEDDGLDADNMNVIDAFVDQHEKKQLVKSLDGEGSMDVTVESIEELPPEKKEYVFPPVSLLKLSTAPKNENIREELQTNATRLVDTLRSFKVRTRIVNISRGPAITRYELAPEEGVRVRAIANLVDDIALSLATTGVRIEAPIPGKAAVGIEVPNKTVSTVYLRELVDADTFVKAQSKLNVSLGVDVAGEPVYLDISKMPHLLIAGATGMGKSVCINSIITSLLYKGTPDEVKLILIDPKKVELNIYNGLPHLLVPVVSDPKKAAGSLQWAVTEMERRFEMIEEVGVRDVKNYNLVTRDDPEKEFLPQIVIIIDELADLMMTAPDDVEASICRLAQKARAAGMHLIIGTQRPSVDVITGLIKANVPSRIAFTVASQTDSRVVLDMAGAEKLIGRGDMLYAPVGASKPRRVQGAFVSESEVESIVSYIKEQNGDDVEYSSDIMASIDRAAASCGSSKKGSGGFDSGDMPDDGSDPMLRAAIELALESDKISTSLIQRRLSLGYGRAAKLIDEMEKRGWVSAPEGQKPRRILITKQQYMEMVVNRTEDL